LIGRDAGGRFAPGYSPDRGRGPIPSAPAVPIGRELRRLVLNVANTPVVVRKLGCRARTIPLCEALLLRLAQGQTSRRTSVTPFLHLVRECLGGPLDTVDHDEPPAGPSTAGLVTAARELVEVAASGTGKQVDEAVDVYLAELRRSTRTRI
jgi:hypothetical protein